MKKYFAKLDGDIVGIDAYIRFEAKDDSDAQEVAEEQARDNFGSYEDPEDEDDNPRYSATIQEYDPEKHDEYFEHINTGDEWEVLV